MSSKLFVLFACFFSLISEIRAAVIRTNSHGTTLVGTPFDDSHVPLDYGRIKTMTIYHGLFINGFEYFWEAGIDITHGEIGEASSTINLEEDEYICKVTGSFHPSFIIGLRSLGFTTNLGRTYGPYAGGSPLIDSTLRPRFFAYDFCSDELALQFMFGLAAADIYNIGFGFAQLTEPIPNNITRLAAVGGEGITSNFANYLLPRHHLKNGVGHTMYVNNIEVGHNRETRRIFYVKFTYTTDLGVDEVRCMGFCGTPWANVVIYKGTFALQDREFLKYVRVGHRDDGFLTSILFGTTFERTSTIFGNPGSGDLTTFSLPGMTIRGLHGITNTSSVNPGLLSLGVYVQGVLPVAIKYLNLTYDAPNSILTSLTTMQSAFIDNDSDIEQTITQSYEITTTHSETVEVTDTETLNMELSFSTSFSTGFLGSGVEVGLSTTIGKSFEESLMRSTTIEKSVTSTMVLNVVCPPHSFVEASIVASKGEYDIPFVAFGEFTYQDQSVAVKPITGIVRGVSLYSIRAQFTTIPIPTTAQIVAAIAAGEYDDDIDVETLPQDANDQQTKYFLIYGGAGLIAAAVVAVVGIAVAFKKHDGKKDNPQHIPEIEDMKETVPRYKE